MVVAALAADAQLQRAVLGGWQGLHERHGETETMPVAALHVLPQLGDALALGTALVDLEDPDLDEPPLLGFAPLAVIFVALVPDVHPQVHLGHARAVRALEVKHKNVFTCNTKMHGFVKNNNSRLENLDLETEI